MSEKRAKENRRNNPPQQPNPTVLGSFKIDALSNGGVTVSGPLDNFEAFVEVLAKAQLAVLRDRLRNKSKILVPRDNIISLS